MFFNRKAYMDEVASLLVPSAFPPEAFATIFSISHYNNTTRNPPPQVT